MTYAPGWGPEMTAMLARRRVEERAAFALPLLAGARTVLDVGCGPGTLTAGLAAAVPHARVLGVDREVAVLGPGAVAGALPALPVRDGVVDVLVAHAVVEHLPDPLAALAECGRVLRPGGRLALCSSDWRRARLEPCDDDVRAALEAHFLLRRRAGGDPFAGGALAGWVAAAGFVDVVERPVERVDMQYAELARYVGRRIDEAPDDHPVLRAGAAAARRWAERDGTAVQGWTEVTARRP